MSQNKPIISFFPDWSAGNPYQKLLYKSLEPYNIVAKGYHGLQFTLRWLIKNKRARHILHFHWLYGVYDPRCNQKHLRIKVLLFALKVILARLLGYNIWWTVHNITPHEKVYQKTDIWLNTLMAKICHRLIVHCQKAKQFVSKQWQCPESKISVIEHGSYYQYYPDTIERSKARKLCGLKTKGFTFLFFGMVKEYKGIPNLIRAFTQLQHDLPDAHLVIAGKPLNSDTTNLLINYVQNENIHLFLEQIPDEKIQIFFKAADIVVLPFTDILTSGSAILALSFGKAIILPNTGCLPELINDKTGFLFDNDDGLLKVMRDAVNTPTEILWEMNEQALNTAKSLSWDNIASKYIDALANENF